MSAAAPSAPDAVDGLAASFSALSSDDASLLRPRAIAGVPYVLLDSLAALAAATALLSRAAAVAVDCEGVNLGRTGRVATLQLCSEARGTTYIVDVTTLGAAAFACGGGLRELLEAPAPAKLFFDVRSDAGALFHHFGVSLPRAAVVDLQLLDVAHNVLVQRRTPPRLGGLGYLLERTSLARMSARERETMADVKARARALFAPELGGSYDVWMARPLDETLLEYATDVRFFHALRDSLQGAIATATAGAARAPAAAAVAAALAAAVERRLAEVEGLEFSSDDRTANVRIDAALLHDLVAAATAAAAAAAEVRGGAGQHLAPPFPRRGGGSGGGDGRVASVAAPGSPVYRSKPCRNHAAGFCRHGETCAFRH